MNKRMDRSRLNIGAYTLRPYARTERHIREIADCGIDFIVGLNNDRPTLDLFDKYGVGAIVSGIVPGWWGGTGNAAGTMESVNTAEKYEKAAADFADHPAIWGIDCGDEPSALDFPHFGSMLGYVDRAFPHQFAYTNLYPSYGLNAKNAEADILRQLGTPTYDGYIRDYCRWVPTDYICYDFYLYSLKNGVQAHCENLAVVADACRDTGRSLWIVLQVNSSDPQQCMRLNNLRFQAYSAMAYGAETITWACYTAGWWHNQVLNEAGEKTEQYHKLKTVNTEIRTLAAEYMHYRRTATHFVGGDRPTSAEPAQKTPASLSAGAFFDLKAENGAALLVGQMVSRKHDGSEALMLCPADDPYDRAPASYPITFRCACSSLRAIGGDGPLPVVRLENGYYSVPAASNRGILLIADGVCP